MMTEVSRCPHCGEPLPVDGPAGVCPACVLRLGLETNAAGFARGKAPEPAELAASFPQFEILELVGQGGMGTVYKVRQRSLDRIAALKILSLDARADPAFEERFVRESRTLAQLNHPNIVTVFDCGKVGSLFYLVMEYVDGVNLREALRDGALGPADSLEVIRQICDALQYAHDQGVVHRDIKPENILLDGRGRVQIADFGLAKLLGRTPIDISLTATNQILGTYRYMAPEQIERPLSVDHRADIYSLGVVLYELLTGELPLGRFALPSERGTIDAGLDRVVLRALERDPARRYQHASELKTDVTSGSSEEATPTPRGSRGAGHDRAVLCTNIVDCEFHVPRLRRAVRRPCRVRLRGGLNVGTAIAPGCAYPPRSCALSGVHSLVAEGKVRSDAGRTWTVDGPAALHVGGHGLVRGRLEGRGRRLRGGDARAPRPVTLPSP